MFKHFGATPVKFNFLVEVKTAIFPDMCENFDGTEVLCVGYEPKGRPMIVTEDRIVLLNDQDEVTSVFKEKLMINATLYRDSKTGLYREKYVQLMVLQRKKGALGAQNTKDSFKTLGVAQLPLHETAQNVLGLQDRTLPLMWTLAEKARLVVSASASAADNSTGNDNASHATDEDNESVNSHSKALVPASSTTSTLGSTSNSRTNNVAAPPPAHTLSLQSGGLTITVPNNPSAVSNNSSGSYNAAPKPAVTNSSYLSTATSSTAPTFHGDIKYQALQRRIEELEVSLLNSAEIVENERRRANDAVIRAKGVEGAANEAKELPMLRDQVSRLSGENEGLRETVRRSDILIEQLQDDVERANSDKQKVEKALRDKNDECEALLAELIKVKMQVGDLSTELDETKRALKQSKQQPAGAQGGARRPSASSVEGGAENRPRRENPLQGVGPSQQQQQRSNGNPPPNPNLASYQQQQQQQQRRASQQTPQQQQQQQQQAYNNNGYSDFNARSAPSQQQQQQQQQQSYNSNNYSNNNYANSSYSNGSSTSNNYSYNSSSTAPATAPPSTPTVVDSTPPRAAPPSTMLRGFSSLSSSTPQMANPFNNMFSSSGSNANNGNANNSVTGSGGGARRPPPSRPVF